MSLLKNIPLRIRHIILYGLVLAILVFILKWLEWKFLIVRNSLDIYIGIIALFFTILGIWVASQLAKPKVVVVEKEIIVSPPDEEAIDEAELEKYNLSNREYEVLQLVAKGHSNAEIAESLFLSLSTVKTHVSNLLLKLDVKSRTKAIEKAKRTHIIK